MTDDHEAAAPPPADPYTPPPAPYPPTAGPYAPPPELDEFGNPLPDGEDALNPLQRAGQAIRNFFGGGEPAKQAPPADAPTPRPVQ